MARASHRGVDTCLVVLHVTQRDRVQLVNPPEEFVGQWIVETVRPGPGHTRLMLKRAT